MCQQGQDMIEKGNEFYATEKVPSPELNLQSSIGG